MLYAGSSRTLIGPVFGLVAGLDGFSLALAKAPAFIGIAQPPKPMPVTRPAPG